MKKRLGFCGTICHQGDLSLQRPAAARLHCNGEGHSEVQFIDEDVLRAMNSLGCFKDKEKLKQELLQPLHNTGKLLIFFPTIYLLELCES